MSLHRALPDPSIEHAVIITFLRKEYNYIDTEVLLRDSRAEQLSGMDSGARLPGLTQPLRYIWRNSETHLTHSMPPCSI